MKLLKSWSGGGFIGDPGPLRKLLNQNRMSTDFKLVPLKEIKPDPNQPRKHYDETAMQELTDSVREKGILQPILIRPNGKGYIIVCGERRFKAALSVNAAFKDRDSIPAVIRELGDDEALELQIIENLQRKDVHPLEEAAAVHSLLTNKSRKLTIEEVAAKLGKTVYYVKQRNRLNSLSKDWKEVFYHNKLHVSVALEISALAEKEQADLYKGKVNPKRLKEDHYEPDISDWDLNQVKRKLKDATFDTKDEKLVPLMGACTNCPFNSAVASLFPEDAKDPVCNNASCFNAKCNKAFEIKLKASIDDPGVVLIYNYSYNKEDSQVIERLRKDGHTVYQTGQDCTTSDGWQYKELKGVPVKGFYVAGHEKGKSVMVKLKASGSSNKTKEKEKEGKLTVDDIDSEITRINQREKRSKEIDLQKIHIATLDALKDNKIFSKPALKMQPMDRGIMVFLLLDLSGFINDDIPGVPEAKGERHCYDKEYFTKLSKLSDDTLAMIIRMIAEDKYGNRNLVYGIDTEDTVMRLIAEYAGIDVKSIEENQAAAAAKRQGNVAKRLEGLKKKKKELQKPATKSDDKKKTVKKKK